ERLRGVRDPLLFEEREIGFDSSRHGHFYDAGCRPENSKAPEQCSGAFAQCRRGQAAVPGTGLTNPSCKFKKSGGHFVPSTKGRDQGYRAWNLEVPTLFFKQGGWRSDEETLNDPLKKLAGNG